MPVSPAWREIPRLSRHRTSRRVFAGAFSAAASLRLVRESITTTGVVIATYQPERPFAA